MADVQITPTREDEAAGPELDRDVLSFTLNGAAITLHNPDPETLLVDYLRSPSVGLTGTKLVCGEGGCGACTVLVTHVDSHTGTVVDRAVNACLQPLCSLDGAAVTTVEGTGSTRSGLSRVQQEMVKENGTQCGYCTPGWVMNMEGLLRSGAELTPRIIEDRFDGNLCRCTGMRPIIDAMQNFAGTEPPRPAPRKILPPRPLHFTGSGTEWYRPLTLGDARNMLFTRGATSATAKLVNGNTSIAVYKRDVEDPQLLIDVSAVPECHVVDPVALRFGAGLSLAELVEGLDAAIGRRPAAPAARLQALRDRVKRMGTVQLRNMGSVAGNLMMTRRYAGTATAFGSDLYTALAAVEASVSYVPSDPQAEAVTVPVLDLPEFDAVPGGYVLTALNLPEPQVGEYVKTYKVARRTQNSHALVNAAFRVRLDEDGRVVEAAAVFGGIGTWPVVVTPPPVGHEWTRELLDAWVPALQADIATSLEPAPEDGVSDGYRSDLAANLAYKFFVWLALQVNASIVPVEFASAGVDYARPISSGKARLTTYPDEWPVGEPIVSLSSDIQATGEAIYTQDLSGPGTTLEGAYVYGQRMHARFDFSPLGGLDGLRTEVHRRFPGVADFVTAADLPRGRNMMGPGKEDPVFADGAITAYGMPIGLVVADRLRVAQDAARWIQANAVAYADLQPIATTIEEALSLPDNAGLFQDRPPSPVHVAQVTRPGSDAAWLANPQPEPGRQFVTGTQRAGTQAHFYFETQAALAVPGERDEMTLYCSSQDLAVCQRRVATALGLQAAKVSVHVTRVGGGFGGKETRPPFIAAAAAVAAAKLHCPVRLALDRTTDMTMIGGRHPYRGDHWVSFDRDGRIDKWRTDFFSNGGNTYDVTFPVSDLVLLSADGSYMVDTFAANATCCRTNRMTSTAMRSFGVIQCSLIVEEAIEHVAYELGILPEEVRRRNFYADSHDDATESTPCGQPLKYGVGRSVWERLAESAEFEDRVQTVQQFNAANRWRKRGISMIPVKYGISYTNLTGNQGGALLTVCESDGTIIVATGGVEMGQGLATKLVQIAAEVLDVDMGLIRPAATATEVVPNASSTGASTGSDLNGGAVKLAAADLKARLERYCTEHEHEPGFPDWRNDWKASWSAIIQAAYGDRQDLSAQALYASPDLSEVSGGSPNATPFYYFSYSAACSEVEIDVLTGESTVVRADILYDAGKSLNPYLDAGQVRGAFVQGLGYVTTEEMYYADDGRPISSGTWNYKPPCTKTIPVDFRVTLLDYEKHDPLTDLPLDPYGIQSSKSTGEPPLVLANTVFFAIKHAVLAARADAGSLGWFELSSPATVEVIQQACAGAAVDSKTV